VQAVVDWYGPTDFLTAGAKETRTRLIGGDPQANKEKAAKASPMTYVSKDGGPVPDHARRQGQRPFRFAQSETFAQALKQAGADVTFVVVAAPATEAAYSPVPRT